MANPLSIQYRAYNQRRLHYSFLFWACLATHFTGLLVVVFFAEQQNIFEMSSLYGLAGLASFLMAFIAWRLHRLEVNYEKHLRAIEEFWISNDMGGIQRAQITGHISSRKLVILGLLCTALGLLWVSYSML